MMDRQKILFEQNKAKWSPMEPAYGRNFLLWMFEEMGECIAIIKKKGATYYGIGACVTKLINCILGDEKRILPVSSYDDFSDVYYGFPAIVGRHGIVRKLDLKLTEKEGIKLQKSINAIKSAIKETSEN